MVRFPFMDEDPQQGAGSHEPQAAYGTWLAELSPAAQGVAALLESLAKTARAARLYAPNNRALAMFREDLLGRFADHFGQHETLTLVVRPDRFLWGPQEEGVYRDDDREQGFPFRLYRDGIRVLTLSREVSDDELLELVRILGERTIGQLEEEDLATRLWGMKSDHIQYRQVTGFVDATATRAKGGSGGEPGFVVQAIAEPPADAAEAAPFETPDQTTREFLGRWVDEWSFPPRPRGVHGEPSYAALPRDALSAFHASMAFDPGILLCHAVARCVDAGTRAALPAVDAEDLRRLLTDTRDGLMAAGEVQAYLRVLRFLFGLRRSVRDEEWRDELDRVLVEGDTRPTLRLLLASVGRGDATPADVLFVLRRMAPGIELAWLAEALAETADEEGRVAVADAIVELIWPDEDAVEDLLGRCDPPSVRALVTALARIAPDGSMVLLRQVFAGADAETQVRILTTALTRRSKDGLPRLAKRALASQADEVRVLGLRAAALTRNPKLLEPIQAMITPASLMEMSRETAVEALRTYAELPGQGTLDWLIKQARPPRMALMDSEGEELRCRYALALGAVPDRRAAEALEKLQGKGSAAFQDAVTGALRRSRRERIG